jgi:hypothetical protein
VSDSSSRKLQLVPVNAPANNGGGGDDDAPDPIVNHLFVTTQHTYDDIISPMEPMKSHANRLAYARLMRDWWCSRYERRRIRLDMKRVDPVVVGLIRWNTHHFESVYMMVAGMEKEKNERAFSRLMYHRWRTAAESLESLGKSN